MRLINTILIDSFILENFDNEGARMDIWANFIITLLTIKPTMVPEVWKPEEWPNKLLH